MAKEMMVNTSNIGRTGWPERGVGVQKVDQIKIKYGRTLDDRKVSRRGGWPKIILQSGRVSQKKRLTDGEIGQKGVGSPG